MDDVWITGLGIVSPLGVGRERFAEALREGRTASGDPPPARDGLPAPGPAAALSRAGFSAEEYVDARYVRRLSALSRSTLVAARLAIEDAAFPEDRDLRAEAGVLLGTAFGSATYHFEYYEGLVRRGLKDASPLLFSESVLNAASGHVSQYFGLRGPSIALVGGEDVGIAAIAAALDKVRAGVAPAVLAGGAEEYCAIIHRALAATGLKIPLAEGAAIVLVEAAQAARRRGARPLAALLGAGSGRAELAEASEGVHVARAVEDACRDAGVDRGDAALITGESIHRQLGEGFGFTSAAQVVAAALEISSGGPSPAVAAASTRRGGASALVFGAPPVL